MGRLTDKWRIYEGAGKPSYTDCISLTSKVQRNAVGRKPRSFVVISLPHSLAFEILATQVNIRQLQVTLDIYVLHHPYIWQHTDQRGNSHGPRKCQDTAQWCEVQCTHFHATWTAWTAQFYNNAPSNARDVHSIAMQEQPMAMQSSFKCVYVRNYLPA